MSELEEPIIVAPALDVEEHVVSSQLWHTLASEIDSIVTRIDNNDNLTPEDVQNVRLLKNQVVEYVTTFNRAINKTRDVYKQRVQQQLNQLGYQRIEDYINIQKQKQTKVQNDRIASKLSMFQEIINEVLGETVMVKDTVLANEMVSLLSVRFPNVKSGAKDKDIQDWQPYKTVITTNLNLLDMLFQDERFIGIATLPLASASMQQIMKYLKSGDVNTLKVMQTMYELDNHYFEQRRLKAVVTTKDMALNLIRQVLDCSEETSDKLSNITKILNIATTLPS